MTVQKSSSSAGNFQKVSFFFLNFHDNNIFFYIISGGGGGHTLQKSKSGKELGLIEVNAPIYPVDTKHTFPPGRSFLLQTI